jgi:hypothetical protein
VFWGGELRSSRAVLVWFNCFFLLVSLRVVPVMYCLLCFFSFCCGVEAAILVASVLLLFV